MRVDVVIFLPGPPVKRSMDTSDHLVIAVDGGLANANAAGTKVDVVIGDMDSVDAELLARYRDSVEIIEFPAGKDETDFELALVHARTLNPENVVIVSGDGGRADHLIANASVLAGELTRDYFVTWHTNDGVYYVCRPDQPRTFATKIGDIVSILPLGTDAHGVKTEGLKWQLANETLHWDHARGMSNVATSEECSIAVTKGTVLIFRDKQL
jgi:thiamine pyrophosphokinase